MAQYDLTTKQKQTLRKEGHVSITRNGKQVRVTPSMVKGRQTHAKVGSGSLLGLSRDRRPEPDDRDREIAERRLRAWDKVPGPRVGDYIIMPDGKYLRFAHKWPNGLQTTDREGSGSFYLGDGYVSMSGSLDPTIPSRRIKPTREWKPGYFWIFHHDFAQADNAVYVKALCRVYRVK